LQGDILGAAMAGMSEMAARVCPEDVVMLLSDPSTPGMVCCVGEDNDNRPGGTLPTAHVYWLRELDNDKMEPISELRILDRALLHGDTVIHNKRKGLVTATRIKVDMRYADGTTIKSVDTDELKHLQPFRQGNWVVAEGWLGRVLSCRDDVVVSFDDKSQCMVSATANSELQAVQKMYERSPFFPSMAVKANSADTFAGAQWIRGSYTKQKQGIIASTRPAEVLVAWIAALQGSSSNPPNTTCAPESLSLLNHFGHTWWRLGDRTIYPRKSTEDAAEKSKDQADTSNEMRHCCEIVGTKTSVDIKYLDGTCAVGIEAIATLMFNPGPHEFYPGDLVCDKDSDDAEEKSNTMSVVLSADERSRMAVVRRVSAVPKRTVNGSVSNSAKLAPSSSDDAADKKVPEADPATADRPKESAAATDAAQGSGHGSGGGVPESEQIKCSVFDLQAHPDFSFRMGDVVLRLDTGVAASAAALTALAMSIPKLVPAREEGDEDIADECDEIDAMHAAIAQSVATVPAEAAPKRVAHEGKHKGGFSVAPPRPQRSLSDGIVGYGHVGYKHHAAFSGSNSGVGVGTVGEVMDVENNGYVVVAWLGGSVSRLHPEEIYRVAIEEEVEDAMFYQEENSFSANGQAPTSQPGSSTSVSSSIANGVSRVAAWPLLQASVTRLVIPAVKTLSRLGAAMLTVPVLGKVIESSTFVVRVMLTHLFRLLSPMRLLPLQTPTAGIGMGVALSPTLLASSLGLGRFLGLSHGPTPAVHMPPSPAANAAHTEEPATASEQQRGVAGTTDDADSAPSSISTPSAAWIGHDSTSTRLPEICGTPSQHSGNSSTEPTPSSHTVESVEQGESAAPQGAHSSNAEHLFKNDEDREWLMSLTETDRQAIMADREREQSSANAHKSDAASAGRETESVGDEEQVQEASTRRGSGLGNGGGEDAQESEGHEDFENVQIIEDDKAWESHHYASRTETPRSAGKFMSRVQKEWNLLRGLRPTSHFSSKFLYSSCPTPLLHL